MKQVYKFLLILSLFTLSGCDLEVENINDPDRDQVLSTPEGVKALTGGLFNQWYKNEQHNLNSPGPALWVMADWGTVTFANYSCVDLSKEPRIFLNNTPSYRYHKNTRNFWRNMYSMLSSANDVLTAVNNNGIEVGANGEETQMIRGTAHFIQGLANGYIGLIYDQAFPSDENTDLENLEAIPYSGSIDMAITQLEQAIEIFDNNTFTLPVEWMTHAYTNEELSKIANSFIARLMVCTPRNIEESTNVDWQKVLNHAHAVIT